MASTMLLRRVISKTPRSLSIRPTANFSTSTLLRNQSFESPNYPGLYLHSLPSPPNAVNTFSLSFLPDPPPSLEFSPSTIGYLAQSSPYRPNGPNSSPRIVDSPSLDGPPPLLPKNFEENPDFRKLLNEVLQEAIADDLTIGTWAKVRGEGYIHIADDRNPADANRVPDPSDIIASVFVKDGKVDASSFSPSETHRLVTMDGLFRLPPGLDQKLRESLVRVREAEKEIWGGAAEGGQ